MSINIDTYVIGLFANNQSRNAAARLGDPDNPATWEWHNIEYTHFDCVNNMLTVLSSAYYINGYVNVTLVDDKRKMIIEVTAWEKNMTQEEAKRLTNEGSANSITGKHIFGQVIGIVANNTSRTAYAWLRDKTTNAYRFQIESTHYDCVTNMLMVLANAKYTDREVEVELDSSGNIISVWLGTGDMNQEELKSLKSEG